jgi:hypothetical protein
VLQLARAVQDAKRKSLLKTGSIDLWLVAYELRSKHGYLVKYRQATGGKSGKGYLRTLRHKFLVCKGVEGMEGAQVFCNLSHMLAATSVNMVLKHARPLQLLARLTQPPI